MTHFSTLGIKFTINVQSNCLQRQCTADTCSEETLQERQHSSILSDTLQ